MSFADAVVDVNPAVAGGCVVAPETRFIHGLKGVLGTSDIDYSNVTVNESLSPYFDGRIDSPVVGAIDLSLATITHSNTSGGTVVDGALQWVRTTAAGMLTFAFDLPEVLPEGQIGYLYLDTTFNFNYSTLVVTFFNSSGGQVGLKNVSAYSYSTDRRAFIIPISPTGDATRVSVRHSRQNTSSTMYAADATVYRAAYVGASQLRDFSPWHPAGSVLIAPAADGPVGGVRFVGPGRFTYSIPANEDFAGVSTLKSGSSVVTSIAFAGENISAVKSLEAADSRESDKPDWTNEPVTAWVFGVLGEGDSVEFYPDRVGGQVGWEWEGEVNNSRSLANVVRDGVLELGVGRGLPIPSGDFTMFLDAVPMAAVKDGYDFWALVAASQSSGAYDVYGYAEQVAADGLYPVAVTRAGEVVTLHLPSGPVDVSGVSGPPDLGLAAGMRISRYAVWDRALTRSEVEGLVPAAPMTVRWEAGLSDGGSPVLGYKVVFARGGVLVSEVVDASVRELVIDSYSGPVAVCAVNALGSGSLVQGVADVGA